MDRIVVKDVPVLFLVKHGGVHLVVLPDGVRNVLQVTATELLQLAIVVLMVESNHVIKTEKLVDVVTQVVVPVVIEKAMVHVRESIGNVAIENAGNADVKQ